MSRRFASFFTGAGGMDLGLEAAGWECVAQVENDPHCLSVLRRHWPDVAKWGDITTVSGRDLPPADLVAFGSPCQDLSIAGQRAGLDGERSGLFHEAIRIIKEMQDASSTRFPRWVIWENVAGAFSSNGGADFGVVLDALASLGAVVVEWATLDTQQFGPPQRRTRVFAVACLDPRAAQLGSVEVLPHSYGGRGDSQTRRQAGPDVAAGVAGGFGSRREGIGGGLAKCLTVKNRANGDDETFVVAGPVGTNPTGGFDTMPTQLIVERERERAVVNALDTRRGGADDNDAQAGHLVAVRCRDAELGRQQGRLPDGAGRAPGGRA